MQALFNTIINMSITGSIVIAAVVIVRFLLRRLPKKYSYLLWSVVAFRLCVPVSLESVISIFQFKPLQVHSGNGSFENGVIPYIPMPDVKTEPLTQNAAPIPGNSNVLDMAEVRHSITLTDVLPFVWLAVAALFLFYGIITSLKVRNRLSNSVKYIDNIYQSDCIDSPFIFGIIKPKIYIPFEMNPEYFSYVIAHERYHIKRLDYLVKLFAFFLLAVHWFNPLCWLAFYLLNKDMEMSCDENVLGRCGSVKKSYSYALLSFATDKKFPVPSPLCFGEGSVKSRIQNILKYKKPTVAVTILVVLLCLFVLAACATNPKADEIVKNSDTAYISDAEYEAYSIGACIGMPGGLSAVSDGDGYAYISKESIVINQKGADEHFNQLYRSAWAMTADITEDSLKQEFEINGIVRVRDDNPPEIPDFKQGTMIMYYDSAFSSSPSYSVYVLDDKPYMIKYAQRYFDLTYDAAENEKLKDKDFLASLAVLSKNQRDYIDELFALLEHPDDSLVNASSNPGDYIAQNKETFDTLAEGGIYTMQYITDAFSQGGQTGLKGHLMRSVMDEIIGGEALKLVTDTGQEYFDAWALHSVQIFAQSTAENVKIMKQTCPYGYWYYMNYGIQWATADFKPFEINGDFFRLSDYGDVLKYDDGTEFRCTDEITCSYFGRIFTLYKSNFDMAICAFIDDQLFFRNVENNIVYRMPVKFYGSGGVKAEEPVQLLSIGYARICDADNNVITFCIDNTYYTLDTRSGKLSKSDFNRIVYPVESVLHLDISKEEAIAKAKAIAVDKNLYIESEGDTDIVPEAFDEVEDCQLIQNPDMYGFISADDHFLYPRFDYAWNIRLKNSAYTATAMIPAQDESSGVCKIEKRQ